MIIKTLLTISLGAVFLLSGCSQVMVKTKFDSNRHHVQHYTQSDNPTEFRYKPVIGTHQPDTKTMIDMGEWAKIWIKNYRNKNQTFVASHSVITMVRAPGFIAGEDVPNRRNQTVSKTYGGRAFTYRSSDLMYEDSSKGNENISNKEIKDYMNSYEYSKKFKKMSPPKQKEHLLIDKGITEYLKKKREKRKEAPAKIVNDKNEKTIIAGPDKFPSYMSKNERKNGSLK